MQFMNVDIWGTPMARPSKLTPKQAMFVKEYLKDLNASDAYRRAGYQTGNANVLGPRMLANAGIKEAVQIEMDKRAKRVELDQDYVLKNLIEVSQRCLQKAPVMVGQGKERQQAKEYVTDPETGEEVIAHVWQFDAQGVIRSNELLGKHLKLFTDKVEHSGSLDLKGKTDEELRAMVEAAANLPK